MITRLILVRTRFEGIHSWPDAPEEVSFLRSPHRHEFHVELQITVTHNDRELEFILVKRALDKFISSWDKLESRSCEMMAELIIEWVHKTYGLTRDVQCSVFEDGENGAVLLT